jgi:hypothetical protein
MHKPVRKLTVSRKQQQAGSIGIEPAHYDPSTRARRRQMIEHSGPSFRVAARRNLTSGFVVHQYFARYRSGQQQRLAINAYF